MARNLTERLDKALAERYRLDHELGRGGMSTVFAAHDLRHDRRVAIKVLHPALTLSVGADRFLREIRVTARLQHPHILPLFDSGEADGLLYYVMPFVEGESLRSRLERERRLPIAEAVLIARDVGQALDHAHRRGVIHRDVKPENILLSEGHALVADFGVAHALSASWSDRITTGGAIVGTPAYMSPEAAAGESVDARADQYALACMVFEMLAGVPPFDFPSPRLVIASQVHSTPPALDKAAGGIPPALAAVVARALTKRPPDRFPSVLGFTEALARASQTEEVYHTPALGQPRAALPTTSAKALEAYRKGRQFLHLKRRRTLEFARELFEQAVLLDPWFAQAWAGLASSLGVLATYYPQVEVDLQAAEAASRRALELSPALPDAHVSRGITLFALGRRTEAQAAFKEALRLNPDHYDGLFFSARAYFQQGEFAGAAALFEQAARAKEDVEARFFAAQSLEALDRPEAEAAYRRALDVAEDHLALNPDDSRAATMRAVALCRLGDREAGHAWAERALRIEPDDAGVRYNVACLFALEGLHDRALDCLEDAIAKGFGHRDWIERDPDLATLRDLPRYQALMGRNASSEVSGSTAQSPA